MDSLLGLARDKYTSHVEEKALNKALQYHAYQLCEEKL